MSVETCSNCFLECPGGYGKTPCFWCSSVSGSVHVDGGSVLSAWSNMAFGRM
jgi:hypothetical protein